MSSPACPNGFVKQSSPVQPPVASLARVGRSVVRANARPNRSVAYTHVPAYVHITYIYIYVYITGEPKQNKATSHVQGVVPHFRR